MIYEHPIDKKIQVGLLAYGSSGKLFHAPFLEAHPGFNFYAVVERNEKRAQQDYPQVKSYDSIDEFLFDPAIDLVIVNTPNYLHYEHTSAALRSNKSVLIEKPVCSTHEELQHLFELADDKQQKLYFFQNRRWDSDFLAVRQVVESGRLGQLFEVHFRFDRYRAEISKKSFKESPMAASGLQYDLGPHLLDQIITLFGKPISSFKTLSKNRKDSKVDDYFMIHLKYENQLNVYATGNSLVAHPQAAYTLHGSEGSFIKYRTDVQEAQLLQGIKPGDAEYGIEAAGMEGLLSLQQAGLCHTEKVDAIKGDYMLLFDQLYQSIVYDKPYPISREDIATQIKLLEKMQDF